MLNTVFCFVFDAVEKFSQGSDFSDFVQQLPHFLALVSLLLGGVVFFVIVLLKKRGQRATAPTFPVDYRTDLSIQEVLQNKYIAGINGKRRRHQDELTKKKRKDKGKESANGQPPIASETRSSREDSIHSATVVDKKQVKLKKKKKKTEIVLERLSKGLSSDKEKNDEEEAGLWVTKISSREKRQLKKERMKQKDAEKAVSPEALACDTAILWDDGVDKETEWQASPQSMDPDTEGQGQADGKVQGCIWRELKPRDAVQQSRRPVEWAPPGKPEEDIFSHVDSPDIISSPSHCLWSAKLPSFGVDEAWLGLVDPFVIDQNSDWSPPAEEWGNWTGESNLLAQPQTVNEKQQGQGSGRRAGQENLKGGVSVNLSQWAAGGSPGNTHMEYKSLAGSVSADSQDTKKERKKKRKIRKET
ncbi:protein LYRIC-like isoform X2 [Polyodon spathula]|uniref:protein LYRIC-like isoform X2 n=1 Tax=Polyodon spathula TaxID=7913 RepID=UPI001B7EE4D5|nr:protein LYRIC-like isoform X2 [Polyodon spathula]